MPYILDYTATMSGDGFNPVDLNALVKSTLWDSHQPISVQARIALMSMVDILSCAIIKQ